MTGSRFWIGCMVAAVAVVLPGCGPGAQQEEAAGGAAAAGAEGGGGAVAQKFALAFKPIPTSAPELKGNPATPEKVELGKMLYFDPRLSSSGLISCNTCHNLGLAGVDGQETSVGHGWQQGPRNAPTVLNAVFNTAQFWDGRAEDLKEQAKGPVQAAVEMNSTPQRVEETLRSIPGYVERFRAAFPGEAQPVSFENMARAIEAFEATLLTPESRFDRYLAGEAKALNEEELRGANLFVDRGCSTCHNGINVGGQAYFRFGVIAPPDSSVLPPQDKGRFVVTRVANDEYVFRAPALRNVALTAPYFHSGRVWKLEEAAHIMGTAQLGTELTPQETQAIVAFLRTLTGEQPKVDHPVLPPSTEATPRPSLEVQGLR